MKGSSNGKNRNAAAAAAAINCIYAQGIASGVHPWQLIYKQVLQLIHWTLRDKVYAPFLPTIRRQSTPHRTAIAHQFMDEPLQMVMVWAELFYQEEDWNKFFCGPSSEQIEWEDLNNCRVVWRFVFFSESWIAKRWVCDTGNESRAVWCPRVTSQFVMNILLRWM